MSVNNYHTKTKKSSKKQNVSHSDGWENFCKIFFDQMKAAKLNVQKKGSDIQLNVDADNQVSFCPKSITISQNGFIYKVEGEAARILYNSYEFKEGINAYVTNKEPERLLWEIVKYSLLNDQIDQVFKSNNPDNDPERQKLVENVIKNVIYKMTPDVVYQMLMENMEQEMNNQSSEFSLQSPQKGYARE